MTQVESVPATEDLDQPPATVAGTPSTVARWLPFAAASAVAVVILLITGTSIVDILRYAAYVVFAVALPGTLVYRGLRRNPHTFVEDVALGLAIGLGLELGAWALFSALGLQAWLMLWPLLVIVPFAAVPGLRRHWRVRGYTPVPLGWSWSVAGVVSFFTVYLWSVFLARNPILPTSENTKQYLDLAYQLSLAGEAKHRFPPGVPQVAGEPLYYHWFGYAHMASTSLIGHIDLVVVDLRFAVPGLCALAAVLTAVVGWRISRRPYAGVVAAVLFWVVGEFNFDHPVGTPFGTQATFVIWHGMSMTYSWVLLLALIGVAAELISRRTGSPVPPMWRLGAYVLTAILLMASSGAKASSMPVVLAALAFTAVVVFLAKRRIPWTVIVLGVLAGAAQLFAVAVLFHFQTYGLGLGPLAPLRAYYAPTTPRPEWKQLTLEVAVLVAFLLNMELRQLAIVPLMWRQRLRLEPAQWFLLGGAIAGPALYLTLNNIAAEYFTRTGFAFGVLLSGWGYVQVFDRAKVSRRGRVALAVTTGIFAVGVVVAEFLWAPSQPGGRPYSPLLPIWWYAGVLAAIGVVVAIVWRPVLARFWPGLRGRGPLLVLTLALAAGSPGLIMDEYKSWQSPNGGAYDNIVLPRSRVDAARWVRDHSSPNDIIATNLHCLPGTAGSRCDDREFVLSAYSERTVLIEGWGFAPREAASANHRFWNPAELALNDKAFNDPTPEVLTELRQRYHVRWLIVDHEASIEAAGLAQLADRRYDNGRMVVYELR